MNDYREINASDEFFVGDRLRITYRDLPQREGIVCPGDNVPVVLRPEDTSNPDWDMAFIYAPGGTDRWHPTIVKVEKRLSQPEVNDRENLRTEIENLQQKVNDLQGIIDAERTSHAARAESLRESLEAMRIQWTERSEETSRVLFSIADEHDLDEDDLADWHHQIGIAMPKPKDVTIRFTVSFEATITPADRETAKQIEDDEAFIEESIIGLDGVDFTDEIGEVSRYEGVSYSVDSVYVN